MRTPSSSPAASKREVKSHLRPQPFQPPPPLVHRGPGSVNNHKRGTRANHGFLAPARYGAAARRTWPGPGSRRTGKA